LIWRHVGEFPVDGATVAFRDAVAGAATGEQLLAVGACTVGGRIVEDFGPWGIPLIAASTGEDGWFAVELAEMEDGMPAARVCFTNDVDELEARGEGMWQVAGSLAISSGKCLADDPSYGTRDHAVTFPFPNGTHRVETFVLNDGSDTLGIRILGSS
jgi:hypothetical protein